MRKNKYLVDRGYSCWYVYNYWSGRLIKTFGTRAEAREYAKRRNK